MPPPIVVEARNIWFPVQVFALVRFNVNDPEEPRAIEAGTFSEVSLEVKLIVELARSVLFTVLQVATPRIERERTNWFVQDVPP